MSAKTWATPPRRRFTDTPVSATSDTPDNLHATAQNIERANSVKHQNRPLVGRVDMLGDSWVREFFAWQDQIDCCATLGKLTRRVAGVISRAVDRQPRSRNAGYAVRSHQWIADKLGGKREKVSAAVAVLERLDFIKVVRSTRKGIPNRYALTFPPDSGPLAYDDEA